MLGTTGMYDRIAAVRWHQINAEIANKIEIYSEIDIACCSCSVVGKYADKQTHFFLNPFI